MANGIEGVMFVLSVGDDVGEKLDGSTARTQDSPRTGTVVGAQSRVRIDADGATSDW